MGEVGTCRHAGVANGESGAADGGGAWPGKRRPGMGLCDRRRTSRSKGKARGDNGRGAYLARDKNDIFGDWVNDSLLEPSCHLDEYSLEFNVFYSFFNRTECLCALIS